MTINYLGQFSWRVLLLSAIILYFEISFDSGLVFNCLVIPFLMAWLIYLLFTYASFTKSAYVLKSYLKEARIVIQYNLVIQCFIFNIVNYNNAIKTNLCQIDLPWNYVPRVVNNLMIYLFSLQVRSLILFALLLDVVLFAFVISGTHRKCVSGLIDASFLASPLFTMCFCW